MQPVLIRGCLYPRGSGEGGIPYERGGDARRTRRNIKTLPVVSFEGEKKVGPRPDRLISFRSLIQNFRRVSRPFHMGASPGGGGGDAVDVDTNEEKCDED